MNAHTFRRESADHLRRAREAGELVYTANWFSEDVLAANLGARAGRILPPFPIRWSPRLFLVHTATAIRAVANVDPPLHTSPRDQLKPYSDPVEKVRTAVAADTREARELGSATFIQGDVTKLPTDVTHNLVVAHPPYLGVIHYNQIHRLATDLFDLASRTDPSAALEDLDWGFADLKANYMSTDSGGRYQAFVERVADSLLKVTNVVGGPSSSSAIRGTRAYFVTRSATTCANWRRGD